MDPANQDQFPLNLNTSKILTEIKLKKYNIIMLTYLIIKL
jgi:hypothetical protein